MDTQERTYQLEELRLRLERSYQGVMRLGKRICSYRYEPNSYEDFIKIRTLRSQLRELQQQQEMLLDQSGDINLKKVKELLAQHLVLEKEVTDYILNEKGYK
ncbi:Hypothetical protein I595_309 [Croceitalea dokdonensis DOKDO 023]|uniref:Uncharacterized protein n=1 Tax=Croceitalea dokdonensis DOKDO 023 TaxID=1300341 RepID=A0A0P7AYX0_9FLAO|nr:hypothetical protein [Croceitalea dokdonensis]KPM33406.1 Hypothetical protein I595_309 [Croceitalea dokdonensis DOKDO 023]